MNLDHALLLYRIAKAYYLDGMSQQEVANKENISRSQVSRLLKKAMETGIVKIDIALPSLPEKEVLENKICHMLNLKKVLLTPSVPNQEENSKSLYLFAADYISKELKQSKKIGIGWGQTMYHISLNLAYAEDDLERSFCALVGTSGTSNPYLQTNGIVDRFAEKFHAVPYYNNFLFCIRPQSLSDMEQKRMAALKKKWASLDTAVIGLGGSVQTGELYLNELSGQKNMIEDIKQMKGDILGNFFQDNRQVYQYPDGLASAAMELDMLTRVPNVICVAHGSLKIDAIISASKQNYIKTLVTDEYTGKGILEKLMN